MSNAVSTTGILVKRGTGSAPSSKPITSSAIGTPGVITSTAHGLVSGDVVTIAGHTGSVPDINGAHVATVISSSTYTVGVNITTGGTGGTGQGPEATETLAELVTVTPPGYSRNKLETTTHNDGAESFVLGILRQKDPTFTINFVGGDLTHQHLVADIIANAKHLWVFTFPSGVVFQGQARLQRFEPSDAGTDGIQQAGCTLAWAGPVTMITS